MGSACHLRHYRGFVAIPTARGTLWVPEATMLAIEPDAFEIERERPVTVVPYFPELDVHPPFELAEVWRRPWWWR